MKFFSGFAISALTLAAFCAPSFADVAGTRAAVNEDGRVSGKNRAPVLSWLGVGIAEAPIETTSRLPIEPGTGLVVNLVKANSPAAIAGIQRNDVLAGLNDQTLVTPDQLKKLVMHRKPGVQVELTFFRKGEKRKVIVVLMQMPGDLM